MSGTKTWREILEETRQRSVDDLLELLRIPSVSTDEASIGEVKEAAEWVAKRLTRAGIENVAIEPTGSHSCVYGDWLHAPGKPTVLIYGHFDVQPADPLELWNSPPFEPVIADGRVYARGASDMKGNLLLSVIAAEAVLSATGELPLNVKFLFEGQEEIGSRDLGAFIAANRERLSCDLVLSADGMQWSEDQPALWMGTKGLCALEIELETAGMDLHSGLFGGAVPNAAHALVELLATLRDSQGIILVEGFYDQVEPLSATERQSFAAVPFNADAYRGAIGVEALVGEPGYSTYERAWGRPTLEINGFWSGYQGDGVKTVIPAKAFAKITCRLVANQEPDAVREKIEAHLERHCPVGAKLTIKRPAGKARPYLVPMDDAGTSAVAEVLGEVYGRAPYFIRIGGSLPITDLFLQELKAYTVSVGFGLDDERIHSPNEFMRLSSYERGQTVYALLLERLGKMAKS